MKTRMKMRMMMMARKTTATYKSTLRLERDLLSLTLSIPLQRSTTLNNSHYQLNLLELEKFKLLAEL